MSTKVGYGQLLTNDLIDQGRYRIDRLIGTGGMGVVYSATQLSMDRQVAIKLLQTKLSEDETMLKRFEQEAMSISSLRHPNIITIFDYGRTEDERLFMVMELLGGESLHSLLKRRRLTSFESLEILQQVTNAVAEAHRRGVIHRDLKPENIHLEQVGGQTHFVKVLDFGIAKIIHGDGKVALDQPVTQAGVVFGTPHYMSPEQIHGKAVDHRSDIYALGILLYELITGQVPFAGCSNIEAMLAQVSRDMPDIRTLCPGRQHIDVLAQLIKDCTATHITDRIQTADILLDRIEALLPRVKTDLERPVRPEEPISATADTAFSDPLYPEGSAAHDDVEPHDFNYTVGQPDVVAEQGIHPTPMPFTGQLNPTGTESVLEDKPSSSLWSLILLGCAALLGIWALIIGPGTDSGSSQRVQTAARPDTPILVPLRTTRYRLKTTPSGATVQRGSVDLGQTPLDLVVTQGEVEGKVTISLPGYRTETRTLEAVSEPERTLSLKLSALAAWVRLTSIPDGARIIVGDKQIGQTPLEWKPAVEQAPVEVRFELSGYSGAKALVTLGPAGAKPELYSVDLQKVRPRRRAVPRVRRAARKGRTVGIPKTKPAQRTAAPVTPKVKTPPPASDDGFNKL